LWAERGDRARAAELLAPVDGWFKEWFDTADLKEEGSKSAARRAAVTGARLSPVAPKISSRWNKRGLLLSTREPGDRL
jgi:hypothetical protein